MTAPREPHSGPTWRRLLPPIPSEHGAWVMLTAALLTPVAVVAARGVPTAGRPAQFGLFVALAVLALLFRETLRRLELREEPARRRRRRWPVPFGGELSGVAALSVAVPAGALSLGLGIETATLL